MIAIKTLLVFLPVGYDTVLDRFQFVRAATKHTTQIPHGSEIFENTENSERSSPPFQNNDEDMEGESVQVFRASKNIPTQS